MIKDNYFCKQNQRKNTWGSKGGEADEQKEEQAGRYVSIMAQKKCRIPGIVGTWSKLSELQAFLLERPHAVEKH